MTDDERAAEPGPRAGWGWWLRGGGEGTEG